MRYLPHLDAFDSNDIDDGAVCDDPFKCPPKVAAPRPGGIGKRPRVKSDIKARKRNYWLPKFRKTNRIQGRVRPKPQRPRTNLRRLKTRRGKAQRQKAFTKTPPQRPTSRPTANNLPIVQTTTTEDVLSLLNQIVDTRAEEKERSQGAPFIPQHVWSLNFFCLWNSEGPIIYLPTYMRVFDLSLERG